jgi:MAE_28990/MAE_18760-like HEPN
MSKIRTVDDLSRRLYDDFTWRREELSNLKNLIDTKSLSSSKHNVLLRSGLTILYAHWEGYIKEAGTCYLEFVSRKKLLYCELKTNFVAIAMKDKLKDAKETNKATVFAEVAEFILHCSNEKSNVPYEGIVSTASNLSSSILREIICILGLDYSFYESKENLIDEKLLKRRNTIAHGEYLSLNREEYLELHEQVLLMMEDFRNQIENNAVLESYRRL